MRNMPLAGLYWKDAGQGSLKSGIAYTTKPTDIQVGQQYTERDKTRNVDNIFEFVRISGTCTVGALLYATGTNNAYVVCTGTGAGKPYAISMDAPIVSGTWQWAQRYGINSTIQLSATCGGSAAGTSILVGGLSGAGNVSNFYSGLASGTVANYYPVFGRSLTAAAGSTTIGSINCL